MSTTDSPRITGKPPLSPAARAAAPGGGLAHPLSERASASAPNLPAVEALAATRSETKVIDPHGLPVLGWNLRYQFKMAVFSEFRQDIMTALQHYYATYTDLIEFMHQITQGTLVTLPSLKMFTRRWEEAKHFLDSLAWKMCKLYLYLDIPASSCELFNGHINSFSSLLASVGYGEGTSYYWKWMTAQHQNFAVLLEIGARHGLTFTLPRVVPVGNARLGASTASLPPNSSSVNLNASANTSTILALGAEFRLPTSFGLDRSVVSPAPLDETTPGCNPATVLQHPGFHYHAAALCSTQFRKRLQEELDHLAATKEAVDESSPTPTMVERLHEQNYLIPLQEKGATEPLFQTTINLLTHAYELFKKYRSVRHTLYMASEIAETYFEAGKYQTAAKFFERIAKTYRREQWGAILTSTLRWSLHCAIETEMWPTVIQLLVELLAPATVISGQERGEYQHELLRTLNAPVERAPTTTPAEPAVPDEGDESAPISRVQPIVVDMTTIYPFVTCFAQFRMDRLTLTGEGTPIRVPYQVVLVVAPGVLASPLRLDAVRLEFSQPQFNTEWTNSYPTWEATLEAEEDKNPSGKQHHVQHMANCTSQRWDTRSLTLPGVKAGERPFWRVEWQKMDSIGESSAPVSTNLWLQDHSYKVLQGELIVSHPRDLQFERIVAEIRTEHHVLALSYPFDDLATRNPPGAFTMGDDRYATKSTWWSTLARQEFGFDRFGQPKWLSVEASKEAKTPQPEEASNNDEADLPSEARNTGSCTLKWTRLPYTGFTHRLAVVDAPLPIEVSCNTGDGPILVHELFSGVIRVDNQSRRNVLIGARITLITADPLAHLADHPFDQVPPDERRSELDLSVTPVALPAGTQHRYQFAMGNFASPGTCQIKIQLQYQPMTADEDPTVSAEWAWSDEPADIQTTSHVYDWVVVEALILNFTGQSMTEPRRSSLASEPETAPSAPGSSPSPRPRMAIDHSSRTSVDSPRRYLLTGRLHNTAFWPIELSNLELLAPETPPGSIPTHPLSPTASSSSPRTSVVWSSFAQLHPRDASPTTAAAAVPDYVLVMPGQSVVHTFLVNTTVSVTSSGYSKRNSQAGKTLGMAQATWRRQLKVEDSVESGQPSGLVGGDPLPSTGSPLEELSRWNYTQFPVEVIGLSMSTRIIVKNVPKYLTDDRFRQHFAAKEDVTDAKLMRTKEGNSRMFGFVGFRTDKAAQLAVRHFNGTYIDTALISVELAKSFKDETLARPWSAHSEGSSAFERRQQQTTAKSKGTKGGHQFNVIDIKKQNQTVTEAIPKKKKQVKLLYESTLNNPKFQEFAQVMAPRHQSKTWANDDLPGTQNDTTIAPSLKTTKVKAQVHAVPNKKPGGAGMVVTKTHVTFADSDDEYEDMPSKPTEKATPASAAPKKEQSDGESDEKNEGEDAPTEAPEPAMSDLEWVRSRMRNTDLTDVDLDAEAVAETTGDNPHSDSASSSDEEPIVDAAIDEVVSDTKMAKPTMPAPETPPTFDNPGKVDTKAADYDPQEIIMETGRLFLRNLPYTCTEEDLRKRFEKFGPLAEVHMPIERDTKQPKGYAYILFVLPEHAWEAFRAMDTKFFQGRLLHVLPAKEKFTPKEFNALNPTLGEPLTSVKKQRELKKKATSKLDFNWNSLYMSQDAVLDSIAERLEVTKDEILDPSASNMAVRMALAETHILNETKAYLEEHGLVLDSLAKKERSETVILVKNIPHSTTEEELRDIFGKHGNLGRILLPPARTIAVVEFLEASEARSAFRFLAYRRFKDSVIYLEKAPVGLFKDKYNAKVHKKQKAASATAASATDSSRLDSSATTKSKGVDATATEASDIQGSADSNASDPVQGVTLFIKNLSFLTQDADFQELCGSIPGLRSAVIRMKPDPKHPGSQLSMGFGFAEYQTPQLAQRAIQALQGRVLDGHALEVKLTNHVTGDQSSSRRAKRAAAESATQGQGSTKLVIRNVAFEATKKELRELLSNYGQLKSIRLPSKMDGSHRGFAFAEFLTLQEAKRVKDTLNHTHLYGRHLVIEFAEKDTTDLEELRARSTKDYRAAVEDKRHSKRIKLNDEE